MSTDDSAPTPADIDAIRAENEALRRQLAAQQTVKTTNTSTANPWWRKTIVGIAVVLAIAFGWSVMALAERFRQ